MQILPPIVSARQSVLETIQAIHQAGQGCAIVLEDRRVIGLVTSGEILEAIVAAIPLETTPIATVMRVDVPAISVLDAQVPDQLWQRFQNLNIDFLVVVDQDDQFQSVLNLRDCLGTPLRMIGTDTDITERKQLELSLQTSEARLANVLNNAVAVIISFKVFPDSTYEELYYSAGSELLFGFLPEELMADPQLWRSRVSPEDIETVIKPSHKNILAGRPQDIEYRFRHRDGRVRWFSAHLQSRWDPTGNCWVVTTVDVDISDRKQLELERQVSEAAFRESQQRYQSLAENIPGIVYRCSNDLEWTLDYISGDIVNLLGYPASDFVETRTRSFGSTIHPEDAEQCYQEVQHALAAGMPYRLEYRNYHADGSLRWLEDRGRGIVNAQGELRLEGFLLDITERKAAQAALQGMLAEKVMLLQEVHHRVKNNLQLICSLLRLKSRRTSDPEMQTMLTECVNRIVSMSLVHQHLYESSNFAQVDLGEYVNSLVIHLLAAYSAIQVTTQINIPPQAVIPLDKAIPCGLILNEILTNALKHGFPEPQQTGEINIELTILAADHYLLTVSNNGKPLPTNFHLETVRGSMGIHLLLLLTEQLSGQLTVEPAEQTTFRLSFNPKLP